MSPDADKLLAVIQARGCDATDLRDAAHEAHHALFARVKPPWERELIHQALVKRSQRVHKRMSLGELVCYELDARAVEWIVCEHFDVAYDPREWIDLMRWETAKSIKVCLPSMEWCLEQITKQKNFSLCVIRGADAVIALKPLRKRKP